MMKSEMEPQSQEGVEISERQQRRVEREEGIGGERVKEKEKVDVIARSCSDGLRCEAHFSITPI